jgi:hypothetical protein
LSAEYIGGTCSISPRKAGSTAAKRSVVIDCDRALLDHLALGVAGVAWSTPKQHVGLVGLVGFEQIGGKLGRLAEAQRQAARSPSDRACRYGRPWRQKTGDAPSAARVGAHALRLVEQQHAINAAPGALGAP